MLNFIAAALHRISSPVRLEAPASRFARTGPSATRSSPPSRARTTRPRAAEPRSPRARAGPRVWWLLFRSTLGFEIRTVGDQPERRALRRDAAAPSDDPHDVRSAACWPGSPGAGQILGVTALHAGSYAHVGRLRRDHRRAARARPSVRHPVRRAAVRGDPRRAPARCRSRPASRSRSSTSSRP